MCGLPEASLGLGILGTGLSAYGQAQAGQSARAQAEYQAAVSRNNQIAAGYQAEARKQQGQREEDAHRRRTQQMQGTQRAVLAANGVNLGDGSAADLQADTAMLADYDRRVIRYNTDVAVWGINNQIATLQAEEGLTLARGRAASQAGSMGAGASLLSGARSVARDWYRFF